MRRVTRSRTAATTCSGDSIGNGTVATTTRPPARPATASQAFRQKYAVDGLDDRAYIDLLYRRLLGRPPDGAGLETYLAELNAGRATRETIALALVQSDEFAARGGIR